MNEILDHIIETYKGTIMALTVVVAALIGICVVVAIAGSAYWVLYKFFTYLWS